MKKFKMNGRIVLFSSIIIICIISIAVILYQGLFVERKKEGNGKIQTGPIELGEELVLKEEFSSKFDNKMTGKLDQVKKKDDTKEIVYTAMSSTEKKEGQYELNVSVPVINLPGEEIKSMNEDIQNTFLKKAISILAKTESNTIYSVKYTACIYEGILSLGVHATLKEGDNPQRVIINTYNYNIEEQKKIDLEEMLSLKGVSKKDAASKILDDIKDENKKALALSELGYSVYIRDYASDMYKIENSDNFLLDKNGYLYIIYAYGNSKYTSETDLVIF